MDKTRMEQIKARCGAATPGPWGAFGPNNEIISTANCKGGFSLNESISVSYVPQNNNADFIAQAREDIPALISEVERLEAENLILIKAITSFCRHGNTCEICGADCCYVGFGERDDTQCSAFTFSIKLAKEIHGGDQ